VVRDYIMMGQLLSTSSGVGPFPLASFGLITCVAALHHMDAATAPARMSSSWRPVAAARPAPGCGRGHRQPRPPGNQGLTGLRPSPTRRARGWLR